MKISMIVFLMKKKSTYSVSPRWLYRLNLHLREYSMTYEKVVRKLLRDHSGGIVVIPEGWVVIVVNKFDDAGMESVMLEYSVRRNNG